MKLCALLFLNALFSLSGQPVIEDYEYELTVASLTDTETTFDLIIEVTLKGETESTEEVFKSLKTPYTKMLPPGEYVIKLDSRSKIIQGKIQGVVNGKYKGYASAREAKILLEAGPGGSYYASRR